MLEAERPGILEHADPREVGRRSRRGRFGELGEVGRERKRGVVSQHGGRPREHRCGRSEQRQAPEHSGRDGVGSDALHLVGGSRGERNPPLLQRADDLRQQQRVAARRRMTGGGERVGDRPVGA